MDVSKYDLNKIENQAVKKSRKLLKTNKGRHLSVFTYFAICKSDYYSEKPSTAEDFFKNMKLCDKYRWYVYDDSLKIIAMAIGTTVFAILSTTPDDNSLYVDYIIKMNPKYIFEYLYSPFSYPLYLCYKDGELMFVHLSDDRTHIVSYPLSELKDWEWLKAPEWLNTGQLNKKR